MRATRESEIYRDLMRFKPQHLSPNAWAVKAGVSRTVWADMRRHGNPSRRTLERLLAAAGSSLAEFEALRLGPEPQPSGFPGGRGINEAAHPWGNPRPLRPLPLIASSLGGEWGTAGSQIELTQLHPSETLEQLQRPATLAFDPDAYALTMVGDSMWPRFRTGRRVAVSPRSPVAIGDDVLVRVRSARGTVQPGTEQVLIKQLVKRTAAGIELRQFNPDLTFSIDEDDAEAIFKVVGELI